MGTSSSYGGPGGSKPLVPSWLGDNGDGSSNSTDSQNVKPLPNHDDSGDGNSNDRFTSARANFTRFSKSGGNDRVSLGRALSSYVGKSSGGSRSASRRMGSSKAATSKLLGFLSAVRSQGADSALAELNLGKFANRPIEEIFLGLADHICPDGGNVDQGIARNAFIETIAQLAENGIVDLESLTIEQVAVVIELFAANSIEGRICNDIGSKICFAPPDLTTAERVQEQLRDFIRRSVSDSIVSIRNDLSQLTPARISGIVDRIYEQAFDILQTMGDQESNGYD